MGVIKGVDCKPPNWGDPMNLKAYSWCINHGVTIAALACAPGYKNRHWDVEVTVNGKTVISPKSYGPNELWDKVFELYKFYYKKYNKDEG